MRAWGHRASAGAGTGARTAGEGRARRRGVACAAACCRVPGPRTPACTFNQPHRRRRHAAGLPHEVSHTKQAISQGYAFVAMNSLNREPGGPNGTTEGKCFS